MWKQRWPKFGRCGGECHGRPCAWRHASSSARCSGVSWRQRYWGWGIVRSISAVRSSRSESRLQAVFPTIYLRPPKGGTPNRSEFRLQAASFLPRILFSVRLCAFTLQLWTLGVGLWTQRSALHSCLRIPADWDFIRLIELIELAESRLCRYRTPCAHLSEYERAEPAVR